MNGGDIDNTRGASASDMSTRVGGFTLTALVMQL